MKLKALAFAGLVTLAGMGFAASANASTVVYTFSDPAVSSYSYNPTQAGYSYSNGAIAAVSGVTFTGLSGVADNGSGFNFATAPDGQVAFIQWYQPRQEAPGAISLDLGNLVAGRTYNVDVLAAARAYQATGSYTVSSGATSQTFSPGTSFGDDLFSFVAVGGDNQLLFTQLASATVGDVTTAIDRVTVTSVPEPASWALMIVGLGGMGFALRRSKRRDLTAAV